MHAPKVVLVKLAAIGDVALAARALREFVGEYDSHAEFHWIIDKGLASLARKLVATSVDPSTVIWHPVDATKLFRGSLPAKAVETFRLAQNIALIRPQYLVLFHRDWRYRALLRPLFPGVMLTADRARMHELDAYKRLFDELARAMGLNRRASRPRLALAADLSGKIGILVGGGRNQKTTYEEKRWPHLSELVELLLSKTAKHIVLFGAREDIEVSQAISKAAPTDRVTDFTGKLTLEEIPDALTELDAFVSIDSGLAHVAAAVMTAPHQKVVSIFGPTDPTVWAPRPFGQSKVMLHYKNAECSPCYADDGVFKPCRFSGAQFKKCMTSITPEEVLASIL